MTPVFWTVDSGLVKLASATMDSKKLALLCRDFADNKKAENIVVLDVRELSSVTDYFVIASGTSEPHLRAIVEEITGKLREDHDLRQGPAHRHHRARGHQEQQLPQRADVPDQLLLQGRLPDHVIRPAHALGRVPERVRRLRAVRPVHPA